MPLEQLRSWMRIWGKASAEQKVSLTVMWNRTFRALSKTKNRWKLVRGPLSATVAVLIDLDIDAAHPHKWKLKNQCASTTAASLPAETNVNDTIASSMFTHQQWDCCSHIEFDHTLLFNCPKTLVPFGYKHDNDKYSGHFDFTTDSNAHTRIIYEITKILQDKIWAKASKAYNGLGLQQGQPHMGPANSAHSKLLKQGMVAEAVALEGLLLNKSWCGHRIAEAREESVAKNRKRHKDDRFL